MVGRRFLYRIILVGIVLKLWLSGIFFYDLSFN